METFVDLYVRKHVDRVVRAMLKEQCEAPEPVDVRDTLLVVQPNDDDMKALVGVWDRAYWTSLQGTARPPSLPGDEWVFEIGSDKLVSNARKIADATVALFWGELTMPLNESKGQMYPWVSHTHTHLGGRCPNSCDYCYVGRGRFGRPPRYEGPLRLIEKEFNVQYGKDRIIFVENCNDLFAFEVPQEMILRVLEHCNKYPDNTYVFQTKNPLRYFGNLAFMPPHVMLGTTIETNRKVLIMAHSKAPEPSLRKEGMVRIPAYKNREGVPPFGDRKTFLTIEPIMDFDVDVMLLWLQQIKPTFVNVGADSKGTNLPEPSADKVHALLDGIGRLGIEIRQKSNLTRLLTKKPEGPLSPANPVPQPKKERIKILHEEIRFCDACIYCHEDGNQKEIVCTRSGKRLPDEWIMRGRQEPMVPMEIPDWCPLPDKTEGNTTGTGK